MPRTHRDPLVGTVIDRRFHIKRPLAEGGMGRVYIARDGEKGPRVAVKIYDGKPGTPEYNQLRGRAEREAETMQKLDHPHIVKTIAHGEFGDGYYLAMELLEGESLTNHVRQTSADPATCMQLLLQLCAAVRYAHRQGIVHRDLKAANVIVIMDDDGPLVKLIDFGVVKVDGLASLSGANTLLGSVHTMPPEHVRGEEVDHRADIYSLGVLGFRLLQGRYPYHSRVAAEVITKHVHAPVPELEPSDEIPSGVPPIIRKCLAKSPDDRYQEVSDLVEELADALQVSTAMFVGAGGTFTSPPAAQSDHPPAPSSQLPAIAVAAGLAVTAIGVLYLIFG